MLTILLLLQSFALGLPRGPQPLCRFPASTIYSLETWCSLPDEWGLHGTNSWIQILQAEIWETSSPRCHGPLLLLREQSGTSVATVLAVSYSPADFGRTQLSSPASSYKPVSRGQGQSVPCVWSSLYQKPSGFTLKKNAFVTLVEDARADLLQGATVTGVGTTAMGSPRKQGIGLSSAHKQEKWEFLAKEQGEGVSGWTLTKSKYQSKG